MAIGDSNHKGNVAELKIAAAAADLGMGVYKPLTEHGRYDLIFDVGGGLLRVQCKWARKQGSVLTINLGGCSYNSRGEETRRTYGREEIDGIAAYCGSLDECFFIPITEIAGMTGVRLRLSPARNGQLAGVRIAADYELGAVAQLVVAPRWQRGGRRFESDQLHHPASDAEVVGAHEFRNRFGLFMQRASRGERFYVTRRGQPSVVLGPAEPSLLAQSGGENATPDPSSEHE